MPPTSKTYWSRCQERDKVELLAIHESILASSVNVEGHQGKRYDTGCSQAQLHLIYGLFSIHSAPKIIRHYWSLYGWRVFKGCKECHILVFHVRCRESEVCRPCIEGRCFSVVENGHVILHATCFAIGSKDSTLIVSYNPHKFSSLKLTKKIRFKTNFKI